MTLIPLVISASVHNLSPLTSYTSTQFSYVMNSPYSCSGVLFLFLLVLCAILICSRLSEDNIEWVKFYSVKLLIRACVLALEQITTDQRPTIYYLPYHR